KPHKPRDNVPRRRCLCSSEGRSCPSRSIPMDLHSRSSSRFSLLARQAFFVVCGSRTGHLLFLLLFPGVLCALQRFGTAIVKALHAFFPSRPMQHEQVPLVDISRKEEVDRLALANVRRAV